MSASGDIIEGSATLVPSAGHEPDRHESGERPAALAVDVRAVERARGAAAVRAYLATLGTERSREVTAGRLDAAARLLCEVHDVPPEPAEALPWHMLRPADMDALAAALGREYSPATANATLSAVRGVLRSAWGLRYMNAEERDRLTHGRAGGRIHVVRGYRKPRGRALSGGELRALAEAAAEDPQRRRGTRDAALLAVLYGAGLRRAEACALTVGDFDREAEAVEVRQGKGRKDRRVPLAAGSAVAIGAWLAEIKAAGHSVAKREPLLRKVLRGDVIRGRLSPQGVGRAIERLAEAASIEELSPHDLRRTYAGDLLEAGVDIVHVQKNLGHASPEVTARYDRRPEAARAKASQLIRFPVVERREEPKPAATPAEAAQTGKGAAEGAA